jgi:peptidoglycan hydrolase-like protein with peptidoglycan-binding domain
VTPAVPAAPGPSATPAASATPGAQTKKERKPTTAEVQRALAQRGYYKGRIDGKLGRETRRAIREFQRRERLRVSGHIDSVTIGALGLTELR